MRYGLPRISASAWVRGSKVTPEPKSKLGIAQMKLISGTTRYFFVIACARIGGTLIRVLNVMLNVEPHPSPAKFLRLSFLQHEEQCQRHALLFPSCLVRGRQGCADAKLIPVVLLSLARKKKSGQL